MLIEIENSRLRWPIVVDYPRVFCPSEYYNFGANNKRRKLCGAGYFDYGYTIRTVRVSNLRLLR